MYAFDTMWLVTKKAIGTMLKCVQEICWKSVRLDLWAPCRGSPLEQVEEEDPREPTDPDLLEKNGHKNGSSCWWRFCDSRVLFKERLFSDAVCVKCCQTISVTLQLAI